MKFGKHINKEDSVDKDIYIFPKNYVFKLIVLSCVILLLGFACHVSISPRIIQMVDSEINNNKHCPIYYDNISFSMITLSLKMKDVRISGACWGNSNTVLGLEEVTIRPGFPGIWPLGLKLNATLKGESSFVGAGFLWGVKKILYIRKNSYLSSNLINAIIGQGNILTGNIFMMGNVELKENGIKSARLTLQSKHFSLLSKTIRLGALPFTFPALKIAPVVLRGYLAKKKFEITSFRLGNVEKDSLFVDFKGFLALNKKLDKVENVELEGELKVSNELLEGPLSILNLFWDIRKKPKRNGIYQIKFSGPFPKALTRPKFIQ